jgi:pimeloyl-ACP methyl ester carboxylesterase
MFVHGVSGEVPGELLLFVHGLNGHRYDTWGQFPHLFREESDYDIGLYGYASGFGRTSTLSATFDAQAEELAHQLRDCSYDQIVLIGHSMGGLMCMAALRNLIDAKACSAIERIACMVLVGTPQAGSVRIPFWARWLSPDLRLLAAHSATLTEIQRRFTDHVGVSMFEQPHGGKFVIPTFAVVGTVDKWVTNLSATLRIPSEQIKRVSGGHTQIAKPTDVDSEVFKFTRDRVLSSMKVHSERNHQQNEIKRRLSTLVDENFSGNEQLIASAIIGVRK